MLTRTPGGCGWSPAAVPAQAAERYAVAIAWLAGLAPGDTPILVELVEFGQVVRRERFSVARSSGVAGQPPAPV